jgi:hypothetical protein
MAIHKPSGKPAGFAVLVLVLGAALAIVGSKIVLPHLVAAPQQTRPGADVENILSQQRPDESLRRSLVQKRNAENQTIAEIQEGEANRAPKLPNPEGAKPQGVEDEHRPEGILPGEAPPISSQEFKVSNLWQRRVGTEWIQIYAGEIAYAPNQGAVFVMHLGPEGVTSGKTYRSPRSVGPLKLLREDGLRLTLSNLDGTEQFVFDVKAERFIS